MNQADLNFEEFEKPTEPAETEVQEPEEKVEVQEKKTEEPPVQLKSLPQTKSVSTIGTDSSGALVAKTFEERWRMAQVISASNLVPQGLNTPEKVFTALQFAHELGLKGGLVALSNIYVVNQRPQLWGDLPLALVRASGKLVSIKEWVFDTKGKEICPQHENLASEVGGSACKTIRRDGDSESECVTWLTVEEAKKSGLWAKAIWKLYPRRMLQCRARAQNLKDNFGDVLMGAPIAEYSGDVGTNEKGELVVESEQQSTAAGKLNSLVASAKTPEVLPAEGRS